MVRIALLEDDEDLREDLASFLTDKGHDVSQVGTLAEYRSILPALDIALLDLMLPDGSGFDAIIETHTRCPRAGVIVLTALGSMHDRLLGLHDGADHYLVKPFDFDELSGTIDALLRRLGSGWRLDRQSRELVNPQGMSCVLAAREFMLLELLANNTGKIVSRRSIVDAFGENWLDFDLRTLDTLVSRLRRRWHDLSGEDLPIKTEYRHGYSFGAVIQID